MPSPARPASPTARGVRRATEAEMVELFAARYANHGSTAAREVELAVIGADWGANGYTTVAEADELADRLGVGEGQALLDVGSGLGWPGLHIAAKTGCSVTLLDLPHGALVTSMQRAGAAAVADLASAVVARGTQLPVRSGVFDGVVHADVIC